MSAPSRLPADISGHSKASTPRWAANQSVWSRTVRKIPSCFALIDQGVVSVTNFGVGVAIGRICGKEALGAYSVALTILLIVDNLSNSLVATPYMVKNPGLPSQEKQDFLGSMLVHHFVIVVASACFVGTGAFLLATRIGSAHEVRALAAAAVVLPFVNTREFLRRVSFAQLNVELALFTDVGSCIMQAIGIALLLLSAQITVSSVLLLTGLSAMVVSLGWFVVEASSIKIVRSAVIPELLRTWQSARWYCLSIVLWNFGTYLYPWILTSFHGAESAGTWAACSTIASLGNPVFLGIGNYVAPKVAHVLAASGVREMIHYVRKSSVILVLLLSPVIIVLATWGGTIVAHVYGPTYRNTTDVLRLLGLNVLISCLSFCYSRALFCMGGAKTESLINVAALISSLTVGVIAVRAFGAFGAALSTTVAAAVTCVIRIGVAETWVRGLEGSRNVGV